MGLLRMAAIIGACAAGPVTGGIALLTLSGKPTGKEYKPDATDDDCLVPMGMFIPALGMISSMYQYIENTISQILNEQTSAEVL